MKVIIIEDEKAAVRNLRALLGDVAPTMEIIATMDSIIESVEWFNSHPMPDLAFMDINLADGSAFDIFGHVRITCPIIFTTAYDEYALKAFSVNCIDYLLKPIGESDIQKVIGKIKLFGSATNSETEQQNLARLMRSFSHTAGKYATYFLVPQRGDKLYPLPVEHIGYIYISDSQVRAVTHNDTSHLVPHTLDELGDMLDPDRFFRVNRQFIISREVVRDIDLWLNNRLSVNLKLPVDEKIVVSRARVSEFKAWFVGHDS